MLAKDVMQRNVVTIHRKSNLADAARLMLVHRINGLPVVDDSGQVVGMVGIRDVLRAPTPSQSEMPILKWARLEDKAAELARTTVERVMARRVVTVEEDTPAIEVAGIMANRGLHPVPVLRDGQLVGIIGRADIVEALLALAASV